MDGKYMNMERNEIEENDWNRALWRQSLRVFRFMWYVIRVLKSLARRGNNIASARW